MLIIRGTFSLLPLGDPQPLIVCREGNILCYAIKEEIADDLTVNTLL
jgi:hypothetical protein